MRGRGAILQRRLWSLVLAGKWGGRKVESHPLNSAVRRGRDIRKVIIAVWGRRPSKGEDHYDVQTKT